MKEEHEHIKKIRDAFYKKAMDINRIKLRFRNDQCIYCGKFIMNGDNLSYCPKCDLFYPNSIGRVLEEIFKISDRGNE